MEADIYLSKEGKKNSYNEEGNEIQFDHYEFMSLTLVKTRGKYLLTSDLKVNQK